jgi:hypothetical protein
MHRIHLKTKKSYKNHPFNLNTTRSQLCLEYHHNAVRQAGFNRAGYRRADSEAQKKSHTF